MIALLKDIVKRYGKTLALDNVNFHIDKGEVLGLLGPNGAGKTTAIKAITGLIEVDAGEITVLKQKQHVNNLQIKKDIGIVTQEVAVFEDLNVRENLRFFGEIYGLRGDKLHERINETLDFIGLTEHDKKYPGKLSGGMARRLNIGCAIIHEPKLLIMDEPTVGIDPQSRAYILDSVKRLAENGTTVIYTSHYMEEVEAISTRIIIMDEGHVIAEGSIHELISKIQYEEKTIITLAEDMDITRAVMEVQGVKEVTNKGRDYVITSVANSGNLNRILDIGQKHGGIVNVTSKKPNLEDVFLTLTGKKLRDGEEG